MNAQDVIVRLERHDDESTIRLVNEAAFGRTAEADLVDRLRQEFAVLASLVAEHDGRLIGHLLFSRVMIDTAGEPLLSVALAPMSVLPSDQRRGVGSRLIVSGLDWLRARNERSVLVLGAPEYYGRFGFSSHRTRMLAHPFPADAFMALELVPGTLDGVQGAVRYPAAFDL